MFKKHSVNYFRDIVAEVTEFPQTEEYLRNLQQWKDGHTGNPIVDQYMKDLNQSGFITHTGRLLVATYLIYILKLNWVDGAEYFEKKLIDYSPASNNWATGPMLPEGEKTHVRKTHSI
ncbi:FAD-binding domain-containing protein [Pedobacter sp. NJ-S-72]